MEEGVERVLVEVGWKGVEVEAGRGGGGARERWRGYIGGSRDGGEVERRSVGSERVISLVA